MPAKSQKSQPKQPVKKITIAEAFRLWFGGKGRSELEDQTGLTRGELRKAFVKTSKKSWAALNQESGRTKKSKRHAAKEGLRRKAA
jgi:hypothetical protein